MAEKFFSERNLKFLLYEYLDAEGLTAYPHFADHDREIFDMLVDTAAKMSRDMLYPIFQEMDREQPEFVDGTVKVHPQVRNIMRQCGEGGWIGGLFPYELGGQQLPSLINMACVYIMNAANFPASAYPFLTSGAAGLIHTFGSKELQETYIPSMFEGKWQGTMALTEPQAGSSLSDITTSADPTDQDYYLIQGQKIFISAGDHDGVDNVVHLMLAKIKGAPAGVKGISLFVVPKFRPEDGGLVHNDVNTAGIYHKMGYRGCPITQLSMGENGDCRGRLVGEPHQGLRYMFQMMNEARIGVGLQATSIASAAYYAALEYARERPQGRNIAGKDPNQPQMPIIGHADVRRMLLQQRAVVEGSLSLLLLCAQYQDLEHVAEGEEKERAFLLLDLLTPIAKSYPSEMGNLSVSLGLQILGGYGYCDEFPLEQYYRDMRIHPIHEGTTGIQGMDLLGRKVVMKDGRALALFLETAAGDARAAGEYPELAPYAEKLNEALASLREVTGHLTGRAMKGEVEHFLADATLYLDFFGIIAMAWQWLGQGACASRGLASQPSEGDTRFYQGKLTTMKYFFHYELPKILGLAARLTDDVPVTVGLDEACFND